MPKLNIELDYNIAMFLSALNKHLAGQYKAFVAGGYLRDLYNNQNLLDIGNKELEPKDLDIVLIPVVDNPVLPMIPQTTCNYIARQGELSDISKRGVTHLVGLTVDCLEVPDVQFIIYNKKMSAKEIAKDMDMNINQIVFEVEALGWELEVSCFATKAFVKGHATQKIEVLHDYSPARQAQRFKRMKTKFENYSLVNFPENIDYDSVDTSAVVY